VLSGFFLVVILFGVFFAMGYIVGRNSSAPGQVAAADTVQPEKEIRPRPLAAPAAAEPETPADHAAAPNALPEPAEERRPLTEAAREDPAAAAATEARPHPEPAAPAPAESKTERGKSYLQVAAVKRLDAELVAETLRKKGFPALTTPGPNDLHRVLVGPFSDAASLGQTKAALENSGFHPFVQK
jgi:cell division septation protein DedD